MDSVDRISELPQNIIDVILQCLTLKDTVRTSILSTHWRYKWTLFPRLILDYPFFESVTAKFIDDEQIFCTLDGCIDSRINEYSNIVNNILLCHPGPIHKFDLFIPNWYEQDITHWLRFLSAKSVHVLRLENFTDDKKLPAWMFSSVGFTHLTYLSLEGFSLPSLSTTCTGFPCLNRLDFFTTDANMVEILVSQCPRLQTLYLKILDVERNDLLSINAPSTLQNLVVEGFLFGVLLKETKSIKTLSLKCELEHKWDQTMELFTCFPLMEELVLGFDFWTALDMKTVGDFRFRRLKSAQICIGYKSNSVSYGTALELIKKILLSSPALKIMIIEVLEGLADNVDNIKETLDFTKELLQYRHTSTAKIIFK